MKSPFQISKGPGCGPISVPVYVFLSVFGCSLLALLGCQDATNTGTAPPRVAPQPYLGQKLSLYCADPLISKEALRLADGWARRTGAVVEASANADSDLLLVRALQVGELATRGQIQVVPRNIQSTDHSVQLARALSTYRDRLTAWGADTYALPLAGEGMVLVYRTDRFADPKKASEYRSKHQRQLSAPMAWEDVADIGALFGPGSLPPLPADSARLASDFNRVAACFDRPGLVEGDLGKAAEQVAAAGNRILSFHHDIDTTQPRLAKRGFLTAASWFQTVQPFRMTSGDSVKAITEGTAVVAWLTMKELGQLPREGDVVSPKFGITSLPGTRTCFDPETGAVRPPSDRSTNTNFIPYIGAEAWVSVVGKSCKSPNAAFDLLADLASAQRSSELLSDPRLGFGPFRSEHLDPARELIWSRFGFDAERTKLLAEAMRRYAAVTVSNPVFAPRSPDQAQLMEALAKQVKRVATGEVSAEAGMQQAIADWKALDAKHPEATIKEWRRKSAGL